MALMPIVEYEARAVLRNDWRIEEDDFDIGISPEDNETLSDLPSSLFGTLTPIYRQFYIFVLKYLYSDADGVDSSRGRVP